MEGGRYLAMRTHLLIPFLLKWGTSWAEIVEIINIVFYIVPSDFKQMARFIQQMSGQHDLFQCLATNKLTKLTNPKRIHENFSHSEKFSAGIFMYYQLSHVNRYILLPPFMISWPFRHILAFLFQNKVPSSLKVSAAKCRSENYAMNFL